MKGWSTFSGGDGTSARLAAAGMFVALALPGCAGDPAPTVLPAEHPANPGAEEAPFVPPPDPFAEDAWITPAPPADGAIDHGAMDHGAMDHGAMDHGAVDHGAVEREATYTCPMNPEIRASKAGSCPQCGMALVPADAPGHRQEKPR